MHKCEQVLPLDIFEPLVLNIFVPPPSVSNAFLCLFNRKAIGWHMVRKQILLIRVAT